MDFKEEKIKLAELKKEESNLWTIGGLLIVGATAGMILIGVWLGVF